jgi:hypothetical protein
MRSRMLFVALAAGLVLVSSGVAGPPAGKGKPPLTGTGCKPQVMVVLKGMLVSSPGASPTLPFALQVQLRSADRFGQAFLTASQPLSVTVTSSSKINRQGSKLLSSLLSGDRLLIQARACKADLATGPTPALTAARVIAHPEHA